LPYPKELFNDFGIYYFRGYAVLVYNLYPIHYINDSGEIYYYKNMTVTICTNNSGSISPFFRYLKKDEFLMKKLVDDFSMNYTYNSSYTLSSNSSIVDSSKTYEYVIITTEKLKNASHPLNWRKWYTFQDLANYKNSHGTNTTIVTVEEITTNPHYWNTTNPTFNDTQAQIRNFIIDAYQNWETDYILLGGDNKGFLHIKDILPIRKLSFCDSNDKIWSVPSDLYYGCLDGNYNGDTDERWGELNDGCPGGDPFEPNKPEGSFYTEADSMECGAGYNVGFFTPPLNLSEYNYYKISFGYSSRIVRNQNAYFKLNIYSNGTNSENFEKNIWHCDVWQEGNKSFNIYPNNYNNSNEVYVEFLYFDNGTAERCSFGFDGVTINHGITTVLYENFENWPPTNWTQIKYNSTNKNWTREYYSIDVDLLAEVYVGRACVNNKREVNNFVKKTIGYIDTPSNDPYLKQALLVGQQLSTTRWGQQTPLTKWGGD
jgi:hypothetical protein